MSIYSQQQYWSARVIGILASPHLKPAFFTLETSTPLAGNATFNAAQRSNYGVTAAPYYYIRNRFSAQANSNTAGTLRLQLWEPTLSDWKTMAVKAVPAGVPTRITMPWLGPRYPASRMLRASFTNGATGQATFRLYTWSWISVQGSKPQSRYI